MSLEPRTEEKRLVPRYPLPKEQIKIFFEDEDSKIFAIRDLSTKGVGIGLMEHGQVLLFPVHAVNSAELRLGGEIHKVRMVIRRVSAWSIGCEFLDPTPELEKYISDFINPLRIGKSLKKVGLVPQEAFASGISGWYHGDSATDLYFWHDARGGVSRALLCMNGLFWEWSDENKIRTGVFEREQEDKVEFRYDTFPVRYAQDMAAKILEHAEVLDYRLVNFLKDQM